MRKRILSLLHPLLKPLYKLYKLKTNTYHIDNVSIKVLPKVFHPGLFFSTKFLLRHVQNTVSHSNKSILELGAGTGLIAVILAKKNSKVYASDINPTAIKNIQLNAEINNVSVTTYHSNLFAKIPPQKFDLILINPPYYPKEAINNEEKAWYCGLNFEFYQVLFKQLASYYHANTEVLMVLSEDCNIAKISSLANSNNFEFRIKKKSTITDELNFIYQIKLMN